MGIQGRIFTKRLSKERGKSCGSGVRRRSRNMNRAVILIKACLFTKMTSASERSR